MRSKDSSASFINPPTINFTRNSHTVEQCPIMTLQVGSQCMLPTEPPVAVGGGYAGLSVLLLSVVIELYLCNRSSISPKI